MAAASPATRSNRSAGSRRQSQRPRRVLGFTDAMRDFQNMFPSLGADVIESVLRANNGSVDATIDQLISMGAGSETDDRSLSQVPMDGEGPPGYSPREAQDEADGLPSYSAVIQSQPRDTARSERSHRHVKVKATNLSRTSVSGYTAPLVGPLPDDFLRIRLPQPQNSRYTQRHTESDVAGLGYGRGQAMSISRGRTEVAVEPNTDFQVLEDERIALYIQNEEFLRELRRNREFIDSLESDRRRHTLDHMLLVYPSKNRHPTATVPPHMTRNYMSSHLPPNAAPRPAVRQQAIPRQERYRDDKPPAQEVQQPPQTPQSGSTSTANSATTDGAGEQLTTLHGLGFEAERRDDVPSSANASSDDDRAFKEKLRHMSKATKKKLHQLARVFSRKKKRQSLVVTDATSRANLLDSDEAGMAASPTEESIAENDEEDLDSPDELQFQRSHLSFQSAFNGGHQGWSADDPIVFYSEDYNMPLEPGEESADAESEDVTHS